MLLNVEANKLRPTDVIDDTGEIITQVVYDPQPKDIEVTCVPRGGGTPRVFRLPYREKVEICYTGRVLSI